MTGSSFAVTDRVNDYINDGLAELHDILVEAHEEYFRSKQTINLVSGTEEYSLPTDFYKSIALWYVTSDRRFRVDRYNLEQVDGYRSSPIHSGTVEHWYVPHVTLMTDDADVVDDRIVPGWEDYVALHAAIRLLIREESDPSALMNERERLYQRIVNMAAPRDEGDPDSIADYYDRWSNARLYRLDERYFRYRILDDKISFIEVEHLGV